MSALNWKPGRGKLGLFKPLLGLWTSTTDSPHGQMSCTRAFEPALNSSHIRLIAHWHGGTLDYIEDCLFAPDKSGLLWFHSFTSDGKNSTGWLTAAPDIHPQAICFESDMTAGHARQVYWPDTDAGFHWAVESRTKKGWNRFTAHHYRPA